MQKNLRWKVAQKAELKWWKRYLKGKSPAEYLAWKKEYWWQLIEDLQPELHIKENSTIADFGCGPAGIFTIFNGLQCTALDPLIAKYEAELEHFSKDQFKYVSFINAAIEEYDQSKKFETLFCLNAINHVSDINKSMDILANSVSIGGQLILSIDAHNHNFLKAIFKTLPGDILHPHQYNLKEYKKMVTDRGFKIVKEIRKDKAFIFDYWVLVAQKI